MYEKEIRRSTIYYKLKHLIQLIFYWVVSVPYFQKFLVIVNSLNKHLTVIKQKLCHLLQLNYLTLKYRLLFFLPCFCYFRIEIIIRAIVHHSRHLRYWLIHVMLKCIFLDRWLKHFASIYPRCYSRSLLYHVNKLGCIQRFALQSLFRCLVNRT